MNATMRVAVCDDALAVKLFLRQVLEEEGDMEVVSATSTGREAIDDLARHQPDALLLDLVLPDVAEPASLVRELRRRSPETLIVLISNMPADDLAREAERLGADGWMPKAQKPDQLRAAVRAAIGPRPEEAAAG
jgi:DNA-binding NarL/FixJ family response regulator